MTSGRTQVLQDRLSGLLCFLVPVGGAKLLEEETESKVKRLVCVSGLKR